MNSVHLSFVLFIIYVSITYLMDEFLIENRVFVYLLFMIFCVAVSFLIV